MYENKLMPLASAKVYYFRIIRNLFLGSGILVFCITIGMLGYHFTSHIGWLDSLHNASMNFLVWVPWSLSTKVGKFSHLFMPCSAGLFLITNI